MKVRVYESDCSLKKCSCGNTVFRKSTKTKRTVIKEGEGYEHQYYCYVCDECNKIERKTVYNHKYRVMNPDDFTKVGKALLEVI